MPESLEHHQKDYNPGDWEDYTLQELGNFVHLLAKRSTHRSDEKKRERDLHDAQNYLNIMQAKLDALRKGDGNWEK